jgi:putative flippase GtrA
MHDPRVALPVPTQVLRFSLVGAGNTAVDAAVFALIVSLAGWDSGAPAVVASGTGFVAGATHSYLWNSRFTFGRTHPGDAPRVIAAFAAVALGGLTLSVAAFAAVAYPMPDGAMGLAIAKAASIGVALVWNFTLMRRAVFAAR